MDAHQRAQDPASDHTHLLLSIAGPSPQDMAQARTHSNHEGEGHAHNGGHLRRDEEEGGHTAKGLCEAAQALADDLFEGALEVLDIS